MNNMMSSELLEKHIAEFHERQVKREQRVRKWSKKKQQTYWEMWDRRLGRLSQERKEVNATLKLVREAMKQPEFWET